MPARAIWRGAISFGMVSIPVRVFTATTSRTVAFNQLHRDDKVRIRQKKWCPEHDEEVPNDEIVRGYEFAKGQYVIMEDEDFENLPVASQHTIDLTGFVQAAEIDPVYYDKTYYLEPEETGVKPFALLVEALEKKGLVAVGKIALRQRESPCAMRASEGRLLLTTLYYADEVRVSPEVDISGVKVGDAEMEIALKLIDMLSAGFDPAAFEDEYRDALMERITAKIEGREFVEAKAPAPAEAVDLVAALKASIEAAEGKAPSESVTADEPAAPAEEAETELVAAAPKTRARKSTARKKPPAKRKTPAKS